MDKREMGIILEGEKGESVRLQLLSYFIQDEPNLEQLSELVQNLQHFLKKVQTTQEDQFNSYER